MKATSMELRILRKHMGSFHSDHLQYRIAFLNREGGGIAFTEWREVPIVDEQPSNKSEVGE